MQKIKSHEKCDSKYEKNKLSSNRLIFSKFYKNTHESKYNIFLLNSNYKRFSNRNLLIPILPNYFIESGI